METHSVFEALQLAISPAILISACGMLLLNMTNRLGRAIDRARQLGHESSETQGAQISILIQRARWIRSSILFNAICIFLDAVLILSLFLSTVFAFSFKLLIPLLFIGSLISLTISLIYFIVDINSSLRAMETELHAETKKLS